ncbi:MAG: plasmid mobilization protein [Gemmatimonadaceae bacterium]
MAQSEYALVSTRLRPAEREALKQAAESEAMTMSTFIRRAALAALRRCEQSPDGDSPRPRAA